MFVYGTFYDVLPEPEESVGTEEGDYEEPNGELYVIYIDLSIYMSASLA